LASFPPSLDSSRALPDEIRAACGTKEGAHKAKVGFALECVSLSMRKYASKTAGGPRALSLVQATSLVLFRWLVPPSRRYPQGATRTQTVSWLPIANLTEEIIRENSGKVI
jgi:hypothetical protein